MATEKRLIGYNPITFESFTRHCTKHREPDASQYDMGYVDAVDNIEDWLTANAVDAVEVVRCKDCFWWHDFETHMDCRNPFGIDLPKPSDFCSYAERKRNGTA